MIVARVTLVLDAGTPAGPSTGGGVHGNETGDAVVDAPGVRSALIRRV
jgi:hypothetical protein